jgi:hypothetical protein
VDQSRPISSPHSDVQFVSCCCSSSCVGWCERSHTGCAGGSQIGPGRLR